MKIEINSGIKPSEIDENFVGLCVDKSGDIWIFGDTNASCAICVSDDDMLSMTVEDAIDCFGPFTKFNGSVTLEND